MKNFKIILACAASWLLCGTLAYAGGSVATQNPYTSITARNAFSLQPITTEPPEPPPTQPLPKIIIKGMMTIFGPEQVLFSVVDNSPGARPSESFYVLREGEHLDGIEATRIDAASGTVIFNNHGTVQRISFADFSASSLKR